MTSERFAFNMSKIPKMPTIPENHTLKSFIKMQNHNDLDEYPEENDDYKDIIVIINGVIKVIKRSSPIPIPIKIHNHITNQCDE